MAEVSFCVSRTCAPLLKCVSGISAAVQCDTDRSRTGGRSLSGRELVPNEPHLLFVLRAKLPAAEVAKRAAKKSKTMARWRVTCSDTEHLISVTDNGGSGSKAWRWSPVVRPGSKPNFDISPMTTEEVTEFGFGHL